MRASSDVSVLLPVHPAVPAEALARSLESLLRQSVLPGEVVIVEDGHGDTLLRATLDEFEHALVEGGVTVQRLGWEVNRGQGAANQAGLRAATRPWILKADSDDISRVDRLERMLIARRELRADVIGAEMLELEDVDRAPVHAIRRRVVPREHAQILRRMRWTSPMNHPTVFFRRALALEAGGYPEALRFGEDWVLFARMASAGARFANVDEALVSFVRGTNFVQRRQGPRVLRSEFDVHDELVAAGLISLGRARLQAVARAGLRAGPTWFLRGALKFLLTRPIRGAGGAEQAVGSAIGDGRPGYDHYRPMDAQRSPLANGFAQQIVLTCEPFSKRPIAQWDVMDVGCGYGSTSLALAEQVRSVVGIEPSPHIWAVANSRLCASKVTNVKVLRASIADVVFEDSFDLVVLDNVLEHVESQEESLAIVRRSLRQDGLVYILVPNKAWPWEAHYGLFGLGWLPPRLANLYLTASGRGTDYSDASYAPTYWRLRRLLDRGGWNYEFVLPAVPSATVAGDRLHYRIGMRLLRRWPSLWCASKALLVVASKDEVLLEPERER